MPRGDKSSYTDKQKRQAQHIEESEKERGWQLGLVMTAATTLNLLLAAAMGVFIPMTMQRLGRDPALGSSVLITACTDSGGFFIFLGLATLFLV